MFKMDMCNCLKKFKTQFSLLKKLTGVLIFFFVSASLWATDYYWIGGDSTSATWADGDKWSLAEGGTSAAAYPGTGDTAIINDEVTFTDTDVTCGAINSSKALSFSGNLTLTSASTIAGGLNIDGALTLSGGLTLSSGDLSVTGATTNNNAGTILISSGDCILANYTSSDSNPSSMPFNTIECSGELRASGGQFRGDISAGSITISGDASFLGATHTISSTGTQHYAGEILVNSSSGSLKLIGSTITFDANIRSWGADQKALIITGNAVFNATAGATIPLKSLSVSGTTIVSGSSIETNEGQTYTGEVEIRSSTSLTSTSNDSITFNDVLTMDNGKTLSLNGRPAISSLVMDGSSLTLSNSAALTISNLTLTSTGVGASNNTLTAGNGSITVSNAAYYSNNLTTSGNVSLAAGIIGTLTADGITTLAGGSISSLAVTGSNLNLTGDLEVTTLSLTGTALTNLELSGSGHSIILSSNQTSGSYLKIASDIYIKSSASAAADGVTGRYYQASDSIPSAGSSNNDYATVIKNGWRIKDLSLMDYTWTGSTSTVWADGSNWALGITPGSGDTAGVDVTIPAGASNYPIISDDDYTLKDLTIESAAELSVNGKTLLAESLDCGGKINLSSAELEITDSITAFEELNLNYSTFTNSTGNSVSITTLTLGSNESSLNAGSSSIAVANNITSGKLKTYGNVSTAALSLSSLNVSSGVLTVSGNVDISGASSALVVDGTLDMDSGSYKLTLTGSSDTDLLSVSGGGTISLSSSQISGNYISLEGSLSIANSKIYTAIHSQNTQPTANPYNGWNILSGDLIYIWDGSASTSPDDAENWVTDIVPGTSDDILIPALTGTSPNYPLLTASTQYNKITVDTGAQLDLASFNLTASEITNNGLVRLEGSQTVTATTITNDEDSTVEYYGTLSGGNLPMKGTSTSFGKLLFSDGANGTVSDAISVAGTTDILCGSGKTLSLTGANTFTGLVKIGDSTTSTSENGGQITINSAARFTLDSNALADSLSVSSSVVLSGNVETVGGGQTYHGGVTTGSQDITLLSGTDTVSFLSTLTGSGNSLSVGNTTIASNARFSDIVSGFSALSVAGTTQINTASITTTGGQTYTGAVSTGPQALSLLAGTDTVTFLSTFTGSANALTIGNASTPSNAIFSDDVSNLTTLSVAGTTQIDAASITTSGGQTYTGAVSTGSQDISLLAGTDAVTFLSTLTGSANNVSIGNTTTTSNAIFTGAVSNLASLAVAGTTLINTTSITTTGGQTYTGDVSVTSNTSLTSSTQDDINFINKLTVSNGKTLSLNGNTSIYNAILNNSTIKNDSTSSAISITTLTLGSNESTLNAGTSSISVSNDISSGKLATSGTISTAAMNLNSLKISSGTLTAGGDIEISGSSPSLTVNGSLKMDSGSYELTLTGSSASDLLSVSGSGSIKLASSQIQGDFIKLEGSLSIDNSKIYTAIHSQNTQSTANPYNGWNILSGDLIYIWDGSASTSPDDAENWVTDIVPGITNNILIPELTGTSPNYPILTAAAQYNKITVDTDAQLDLASFNLTASKITNNGLVRLAGSQTVTATTITNDSDSTVEYYGTLSDGNLPMKGTSTSFGKLLFSDGANGTVSDVISVADTTEIYCGSSNALSLTGANTFTGLLTAGDSTTSVNAGELTLNAASAFTLDSNALAESLTIQSAVNLSGNVTTSGGQTYTGEVTTGSQNITLLSGTDTVSFQSTLTGSGNALSVGNSTTASNARFSDVVSGFSALSVAGTTQINTSSITTTGGQTYTGAVSTGPQALSLLAGTDTVTFLSTFTGSANALTIGNASTPSNAIFTGTVSNLTTLSVAGTTQIDAASITTSGGQTYTGAVSTGTQALSLLAGTDAVTFLSTLTGSANNVSIGNATSTSNAIFTGTVSSLATLSVAGTTLINTTSITTSGGQTYTGNVSVTQDSSLTSSTTDAINFSNQLTVASVKTLSLSGTTSINTALLNGSTIRNTSTSGTLSITTLNLGSNESSLDAGSSSIAVANNITSGKLKTYGNVSTVALTLSSLNVSSGTLTAGGDIEISGSSPSLTVIGNLKMDSGEHELKLTGSSGDLLKVSGSGTIILYSSQITGNYISLEGSLSIANSKIYTAIHSQNTQSTANPYNGWNILTGDLIFMWDGSTSTSVLDAENWITDIVPGTNNDILIPSLSGASPNYPILTAAAQYNKITVDTGAQLDLASFNLSASEITNNGLVRLAGSQTVTATTITNNSDSTVEYYGTLNGGNLPMKGTSTSFGKLLFSDGANGTISDAMSVANTTEIYCGSSNALSLTGANTFTGLLTAGNSSTSVNAGELTVNAASAFTLASNALAESLTVQSAVLLSGNVTTSGGQTYHGGVTTGSQNITLLSGTDTVSFLSTLTGSGNSLSVGNTTTASNVIFSNAVAGFTTLSVAGTTQINTSSITTSGGQTYSGGVTTGSQNLTLLSGTNTVSFLSTLTGSGNTLSIGNTTTASNARFSDAVTGFSELSVAGTTQIDASSITTTGGQTYTGGVTTGSQNLTLLSGTNTISFLSTLTGSANNVSIGNATTASNAIFTGAVSNLASLSVAGTTQINTTSITTSGGQTYTGAVSTGTQDLTLLAGTDTITFLSTLTGSANNLTIGNSTTPSNVTFSAPVSNLTSLLITGATQIDTNSITTTGGQTYTGNVTTTSTNTTLLATDDDSIINFKANLLAATNNLTINCGTHLTSGTSATITAGDIQIIGNYENTGSITSNAASTSVTKNVLNTGSADFTNGISLAGNFTDTIGDWTGSITLNGTDAQNFNPNTTTTYSNILINKTNGITNFTDTVTITTLTDSTTYTADINFYKNINILTDTSLNTSGKIIFASQADSITSFTSTFGSSSNYKDFTHTAGQTILDGNIIADEITLAESNLKGITNINCTNLTLQNDLTCTLETYYLKLTGNLTTSGTHNFYPNVMIDGSFIGGGSSIFKKNLYFFKDSSTASTASINSLTVDGDLIISAERAFNTSGTIRTKKNFVLYRGQISAAASSVIQADLDIILLGQFYSLNDASRSSNPSNTDYIYQQTRTNGSCNYTRTDFSAHNDQMPDGTYLPDSTDGFTGLYTGASGSVLHAGKNWYANGLKDSDTNPTLGLTASSQWYIDIPDLTDTQNQTGFAETYNSYADHNTVRCHTPPAGTTAPDANGIYSRMPAYNCSYQADSNGDALTNVNWLFTDLLITQAYTERDNSIYIEFNRAVRNSNNELKNAISRFTNSSVTYQGFYTDPDCTSALPDNTNRSEDSANKVWLYLKTANSTSWNTDATGTSAGNSASTNRYGIHQNVIPYIKVSENNSYPITDIWGKRLAYYDGTSPFENVTDHTGPVLYSVRTGQEFHSPYNSSTGESSQQSYDSHNFLEFRYSEAVNFGSTTAGTSTPLQNVFDNSDITSAIWLPAAASTSADNTVNIRVRDSFGALTNSITQSGNLTLAGLATIENGKLHTASQGVDNKYVNALYRQDSFSIRLSLAGYTEGTATDQHSNIYKKWTGYIESAIQPSGLVSLVADTNNLITDCALDSDGVTPLYNPQIRYADDATVTPSVNIIYSNGNQYDSSGIYGNWDLSEPVFATLRLDSTSDWAESLYFEAVGTNSGSGSTLDKIEFHIFDNTPAYSSSDPAIWLSEKGWVTNTAGSSTLYDASYSYCADITGGSKQFDSDSSQRSSGGIRYSTLETSSAGFKYSSGQGSSVVPSTNFVSGINGIYTGAKASLFVGSSTTRRSPTDPDGLYFGLGLSDTTFPVTQSFTVSYDEDSAYITDLAGNRLRSKTIRTIDRTPPSFDITLSPVSQKELNVVFVKKLITDSTSIKYRDNTNGNQINITEEYESLIPKCFDLISISSGSASTSSSINIDYTVPAKIQNITSQTNDSEFTVITLTLTQNISLNDLQNLYIRLKYADEYQELTQDPVTGINNSRVTFIQDELGNYMQMYSAHAISDFAINVVNPLYAYDSEMTYDSQSLMDGLYNEGSWAVHDWNVDQQNYGSLPANHEYELVADIDDGTEDKTYLPSGVRAYFAINQTSNSVSSQYNSDFNTNLRVWLPALSNSVIAALSPINNDLSNILTKDSVTLDSETPERINFTIGKDFSTTWGSGKQVSFLFGLLDTNNEIIRIYNAPYYDVTNNTYNLALSTAVPLFALRTKDSSVLSSLDLWSFKTHASVEQRGGVTILNNVIDLSNGEKTVLKVNNPSNGKVNIMVMTLDGNIITYLNRGNLTSGQHYFYWDGKNKKNNQVARGMYFIRIVGNGFDETRKVLVTK